MFHEPQESEKQRSFPTELHTTDLELARAARAGASDARREFAQRMACVPRMLSVLNARMGRPLSAHDLEDLVQDSMVVIWKGLATYGGHSSLEAWTFRCCHHELLSRLRKRGRMPLQGELVDLAAKPGSNAYDDVYRALERLDPRERRVVELKHFEDLTFEQIGARIETSPNTVKTWYYQAIAELKRLLSPARRDVAR
ncbi:MAG: RNA polymerase sigma factor [Planctomycetes bacterium]|nr:RNA polymerase sigma factor [Planctomycetota bacterium]